MKCLKLLRKFWGSIFINDGNKKEKKEVKNSGDENSQASNNKSKEEKTEMHDTESEALEILQDMPPEIKKRFLSISKGSFSRSILSPLESKINEKHIDKILVIKEKYEDNIFSDTQSARKFQLIYILLGVALFVFLTLFLVSNDKDLFKEIIKLFIAFVGGFGAGYGIKSYKDSR
jgi:hypothetical protein